MGVTRAQRYIGWGVFKGWGRCPPTVLSVVVEAPSLVAAEEALERAYGQQVIQWDVRTIEEEVQSLRTTPAALVVPAKKVVSGNPTPPCQD